MPKKNTAGNDAAARFMVDVLRVSGQHLLAPLNYLRGLTTRLTSWIRGTASIINRTVRLTNILREAKLAIAETYRMITRAHTQDLKALAVATIDGARAVLSAAAGGANVFTVAMTEARARAIAAGPILSGSTVTQSWGRQAQDLQWKYEATVRDGIFRNQSAEQLAARVEGTKESNYNDGLMPKKLREAQTITDTAATAVANAVMAEAMATTKEDAVEILIWSATLDAKTCRRCSALHGHEWVVKDGQISGESITPSTAMDEKGKLTTVFLDWPGPPPLHANCRCVLTPDLRPWASLSKEAKAAVRSVIGDAVADELDAKDALDAVKEEMAKPAEVQTFDEWLAGKSHAEVEKILGPGRAKLWEAGVPVSAMVNPQTLEPLTIAQMQAKWTGERSRSNRDFLALMAALSKKKRGN